MLVRHAGKRHDALTSLCAPAQRTTVMQVRRGLAPNLHVDVLAVAWHVYALRRVECFGRQARAPPPQRCQAV